MISYATLLDLARQRLRDISSSPKFTRDARHTALSLLREVEDELDQFNTGHPRRALVKAFFSNDEQLAA